MTNIENIKECVEFILSLKEQYLDKQTLTPPTVRPCIINGKKGFFHMWSEVINGEKLKTPVGVVELECGICLSVPPGDILFTDRSTENE